MVRFSQEPRVGSAGDTLTGRIDADRTEFPCNLRLTSPCQSLTMEAAQFHIEPDLYE